MKEVVFSEAYQSYIAGNRVLFQAVDADALVARGVAAYGNEAADSETAELAPADAPVPIADATQAETPAQAPEAPAH